MLSPLLRVCEMLRDLKSPDFGDLETLEIPGFGVDRSISRSQDHLQIWGLRFGVPLLGPLFGPLLEGPREYIHTMVLPR